MSKPLKTRMVLKVKEWPVALKEHSENGGARLFSGCYINENGKMPPACVLLSDRENQSMKAGERILRATDVLEMHWEKNKKNNSAWAWKSIKSETCFTWERYLRAKQGRKTTEYRILFFNHSAWENKRPAHLRQSHAGISHGSKQALSKKGMRRRKSGTTK